MLPNMVMPVPFFVLGTIAIAAMGRRKTKPSGASGLSIADRPSGMSGQQNRLIGGARPISVRRRNCARCVSR